MMHFSQLQKITKGQLRLKNDMEVTGYSTDSRTLSGRAGNVFIAIKAKRDGHDYVKSAYEKGVRNFIVQQEIPIENGNILLVKDSFVAFQKIASNHRQKFQLPIVAITGSNGKTIVKEWLSTLLSKQYFVVKSPKSYNSQIGVPLSLLEIKAHHKVGIFEAGISQPNEMTRLRKMINPIIGIFTNLGEAHDNGFDSTIQKLHEKWILFENSDKIICRSDQGYSKIIKQVGKKNVVFWGLDDTGDYHVSWNKGTIKIDDYKFISDFKSPTHYENLTHAIVTCLEMGLDPNKIQKGINLLQRVPMRLELKKGINGCYILDDSYNNDEAGLKVALNHLEIYRQNKKRTLILSDILHTGKTDRELYRLVAELLMSKNISRLIGVGHRISHMKSAFIHSEDKLFFESTEDLIQNLPSFQNEMIVIKGARDFKLERVVQQLEDKNHGTVLEVNFESLQYNLNQYRSLIKSETKLMVMVKANAYGSGILEVANFLQHQQVDMLGVAYLDEAIRLRKNGISIPIMIMNPHISSFEQFEYYNLQAEIFSLWYLNRMLKDTQTPPDIHLKIDTGMHRLGFTEAEISDLIDVLSNNPHIQVKSIFTHFSSSENHFDDDFTKKQLEVFEIIYNQIIEAIGYRPMKHVCNSSAIVRWPQYHYDMVRLGIGLYGLDPTCQLDLKQISELKTTISQIKKLKKDDTVGYSRKGRITKASKIAVIPLGYEDGYSRVFGNGRGLVQIGDKLCHTLGDICMDMTMIDITGIDVCEGDEVIVFGEGLGIKKLAKWADTIPYEILTNISSRVKRVFIS